MPAVPLPRARDGIFMVPFRFTRLWTFQCVSALSPCCARCAHDQLGSLYPSPRVCDGLHGFSRCVYIAQWHATSHRHRMARTFSVRTPRVCEAPCLPYCPTTLLHPKVGTWTTVYPVTCSERGLSTPNLAANMRQWVREYPVCTARGRFAALERENELATVVPYTRECERLCSLLW